MTTPIPTPTTYTPVHSKPPRSQGVLVLMGDLQDLVNRLSQIYPAAHGKLYCTITVEFKEEET